MFAYGVFESCVRAASALRLLLRVGDRSIAENKAIIMALKKEQVRLRKQYDCSPAGPDINKEGVWAWEKRLKPL